MKALFLMAAPLVLAASLAPPAAVGQGLLRGPDLAVAARVQADPPGVQVTRLNSGALLKRMPGQAVPGEAVAPPAARLAARVSVQQVGNVQALVAGTPVAVAESPRPAGLTVRTLGKSLVLELPGQRTPGLEATALRTAVPAGFAVADLAAGQPLPAFPAPATLYRRLPAAQ